MNIQSSIMNKITQAATFVVVFMIPFFFLPVTRDFLIYSKFYFVALGAFVLVLLSFGKFLLTKKFSLTHNIAAQSMFLIGLAYILSIVLMSPNKLQAVFNPQYGFVMIISMMILYFYAAKSFIGSKIPPIFALSVSALVVSIFALVVMVDPFSSMELPTYWSFLSATTFNVIGSSIDFLAFMIVVLVGSSLFMWRSHKDSVSHERMQSSHNKTFMIIEGVVVLFILLASIFHIFIIAQQVLSEGAQIILPPVIMSWHAAVEVLKQPMTALFGVGVDNFSSLFTQVRTVGYNSSNIWQINSFNTSRSAFLHIFTELGIFGAIGYGLVISLFLKYLKEVKLETAGVFISTLVIMLLLPPSIISFFLFFASLAMMSADIHHKKSADEYIVDLSNMPAIFIGVIAITLLTVGSSGYFLGRNFMGEFYFKKSFDAISENNLQKLYDNQAIAISYNPSNEEFHRQFAQTNLIAANNVASVGADKLTDQDRALIEQAIQASIVEAKAAVSLNPYKVTNWQLLAGVYRQIINVAENAPTWAVSAYQQAVVLDPRNPAIRLDLGGVFYLLGNYDEAQNLFEQSVSLKPDWPNAHYNLAWTYFQKGIYGSAVDQMQIVVGLLDPATQEADFKAAQKDLKEFDEKYQEALTQLQEQQAADAASGTSTTPAVVAPTAAPAVLNLPSPPATNIEEKVELPEASAPNITTTPTPEVTVAP